jgi:quinol-cytochrome oxidoreductase complex cytochrome b subunit
MKMNEKLMLRLVVAHILLSGALLVAEVGLLAIHLGLIRTQGPPPAGLPKQSQQMRQRGPQLM